MNPISTALEEGYSEEELLAFISSAFPGLRKKLSKAVSSGYSASQIIPFVSNLMGNKQPKKRRADGMSQQAIHAENMHEDQEKQEQLLKTGLQLAGGVVAGRALQHALPKISSALKGNLPARGARGMPAQTPKQTAQAPITQAMGQTQAQAANAPTTPSIAPQTIAPRIKVQELKPELDKLNLTDKIEKLAARNAPETIGAMLNKMVKPEQVQELESRFQKPFSQIVKDYADEYLSKVEESPLSRESLTHQFEQRENENIVPINQSKEGNAKVAQPTQKSAMLPNGQVGDIVDERQGIATVKLPNGQERRQKIIDMVEGPEDAAVIALELIKSFTPEEERSAHHALSAYNDEDKTGFFLFHNGNAYTVYDISPEEYKDLSEEVVGAKTTGKTPYAEWSAGMGSRGAAYNKMVKGQGMPEGYEKKKYKKLLVNYDLLKRFREEIEKTRKKSKPKA